MNAEDEQGWVPSSYLEREDGTAESTTQRLKPGQGITRHIEFIDANHVAIQNSCAYLFQFISWPTYPQFSSMIITTKLMKFKMLKAICSYIHSFEAQHNVVRPKFSL